MLSPNVTTAAPTPQAALHRSWGCAHTAACRDATASTFGVRVQRIQQQQCCHNSAVRDCLIRGPIGFLIHSAYVLHARLLASIILNGTQVRLLISLADESGYGALTYTTPNGMGTVLLM